MSILLGITGYARSGKDSVGEYLVKAHGFRRIAFADKMREAALALNPIIGMTAPSREHPEGRYLRLATLVDCMGWEKAKSLTEVRRTLQRLGTEVGRNLLGEDLWVNAALDDIAPDEDVVVTDVRFPNEGLAIERLGGVIIRVERPGINAANAHSSEVAMSDYLVPYVLANAGTLIDLADGVDTILLDLSTRPLV